MVDRRPPLPVDGAHWRRFWPGHNKWNVEASLTRRPDAFFQVWGPRELGLRVDEVMRAHGYVPEGRFWVRPGSPWVVPPEQRRVLHPHHHHRVSRA